MLPEPSRITVACWCMPQRLPWRVRFFHSSPLRFTAVNLHSSSAAAGIPHAPSHMLSTRSTSPPKSACPGVSMMLILIPCRQASTRQADHRLLAISFEMASKPELWWDD